VTVEYLDLADYVAIAAEVTGLDVDVVMKVVNLDLADSALHAPAAGFGDEDFYPDFVDKAAVLVVRLAKNHPAARWQQARRVGGPPAIRRPQWMVLASEA
jgi:death-on-curing protein